MALLVAMTLSNCGNTNVPPAAGENYNRLIHEKSPYLVQHATNPIWWYPWGEEALSAARRENKPIFLSIGYSTCYWCHFMEKDSFEKQDVADILNKYFIAIKVDREERPEVDNIYMTALVSITGAGGWPMSMFLTPDGHPFFGASTIPHDNFISILTQIADAWKTEEPRIRESGGQIAEHLSRYLNPSSGPADIDESLFHSFFREMRDNFDETHAGFGGGGNKFPRPHLLSALLRVHRRSGDSEALRMAASTLKAMARGGIHDQLAGGFHRYSVDPAWDIPHFEKMLYDNAGLAVAYLEAYQVTGDNEFAQVARKTLNWILAEMTHPDGGFYSAQDAGDFGKEGEYYAWSQEELTRILSPQEFEHIQKIFQITKYGNFEENKNVFHVPEDLPLPDDQDTVYAGAHRKLLKARAKRPRPRLDDKVLTDWNGLAIAAMARGYQALGDKKYLSAAQKAATFIRTRMQDKDGQLFHRWRDGEAAHRGLLDDYAFLIHGLLELYQSDFDDAWFLWAVELQTIQDKLFWDEKGGAYFIAGTRDPTLVVRSKDFEDMAIPSGNSIAALNLLRLSGFTYKNAYRDAANQVIRASGGTLTRSPAACPQLLIALDYAQDRSKEIAIVGSMKNPVAKDMILSLRKTFLPNKVVAFGSGEKPDEKILLLEGKLAADGKPTGYVCEDGACRLPASDSSVLLKQASDFKPLKW